MSVLLYIEHPEIIAAASTPMDEIYVDDYEIVVCDSHFEAAQVVSHQLALDPRPLIKSYAVGS